MVRRFLFETRLGEWLLTLLERGTGLALVDAAWLESQPGGRLRAVEDA